VRQLYFIPGRAFSNLPLHLLAAPNRTFLMEEYPISFIPNISSLALPGNNALPSKRRLLVHVDRAVDISSSSRDNNAFIDRMSENYKSVYSCQSH
jgi:CHAT domain-containing protein